MGRDEAFAGVHDGSAEGRETVSKNAHADAGDPSALRSLNTRFIEACRQGSWELLEPILSPSFSYLDGATGEVWEQDRYVEDLRGNPLPTLEIDQVVGTSTGMLQSSPPGAPRERVDSTGTSTPMFRLAGGWRCTHACVWPLRPRGS